MKKVLKFITAVVVALGPIWLTVWGLFFKLAPYITSLIPAGEWHALLSVLVYFLISACGGIEIVIFAGIIGTGIATILFGK